MKYHLQVNGKVVKQNLSKSKAFEYFDLLRLFCGEQEVTVICTTGIACFTEDEE